MITTCASRPSSTSRCDSPLPNGLDGHSKGVVEKEGFVRLGRNYAGQLRRPPLTGASVLSLRKLC